MRNSLRAAGVAVALVAAAGCGGDSSDPEDALPGDEPVVASDDGAAAPEDGTENATGPLAFTAATVGGGELNGADIKGDAILWFWAPW